MNIEQILNKASSLRIAVVGDRIIDRYVFGDVTRISPEAPVQILKITGTKENPGGAGNVVENLKGLGCQVDFYYDDKNCIIKTRVMSGNHHLLRMDDEDEPRWIKYDDLGWELDYNISRGKYNCVVISDYGKGTISRDVTSRLIRLCNQTDTPIVVDTKHQFNLMHHATIVKCNFREWNSQNMPFPESPYNWMEEHDVQHLVVTNGSRGMMHYTLKDGHDTTGEIPGVPVAICDACGAGDTVTAVLAMCLGGKVMDLKEACELANIAAAEVCKHPGVYAIQKDDLLKQNVWPITKEKATK